MLPSAMVILMAIEVSGDFSRKRLSPLEFEGEYIRSTYDSLVARGHLRKNRLGVYQLTQEGRESLFEFLLEDKARVKEIARKVEQLGIEAIKEIDEIAREVLEVK